VKKNVANGYAFIVVCVTKCLSEAYRSLSLIACCVNSILKKLKLFIALCGNLPQSYRRSPAVVGPHSVTCHPTPCERGLTLTSARPILGLTGREG